MQRIRDSFVVRICTALLLTLVLVAPAGVFAQSFEVAQESDTEITRTPRTGNTTDENTEDPQPEEEATSQPEGSYTGPVYGYSIEYDPAVWTLDTEIQEGQVDGIRLFR